MVLNYIFLDKDFNNLNYVLHPIIPRRCLAFELRWLVGTSRLAPLALSWERQSS